MLTIEDDAETKFITVVETLTTDDLDWYHIAAATPIIPMFYKESDMDGNNDDGGDGEGADDDGGNGDGDSDGNAGDDGDDGEDAAPSIRALSYLSLGAVAIGLLAGAGVLMPW